MSTELAIRDDYPIVEAGNINTLLAGASPDDITIPTVKFPSSGSTVWQIPTEGDAVRNSEAIEGVVVDQYAFDVFYLESFDDNPDAKAQAVWVAGQFQFATDEAIAAGVIAGAPVSEQPLNEFETDLKGGKGKAISNRWTIYIVEAGEMLPIRVSVPTMSRKTWFNFQMRAFMAKPSTSFTTSLTLKSDTNGAGQPYSEMVATKTGELSDEAAKQYKALGEALAPLTAYRKPHLDAPTEQQTANATVNEIAGQFDGTVSGEADDDMPF